MFELELKFKPTEDQKIKLISDSLFAYEENFIDVYYNKKDYTLSRNDIWLRSRNDIFMLKKPLNVENSELKRQKNSPKEEITDIGEMMHSLNIKNNDGATFHEMLIYNGIYDLYRYKNNRKKYKKDDFIIDFDSAIFENGFKCEVCEIEIIVYDKSEVDYGINKIKSFASHYGMKVEPVKARLIEYIERINPEHYRTLSE